MELVSYLRADLYVKIWLIIQRNLLRGQQTREHFNTDGCCVITPSHQVTCPGLFGTEPATCTRLQLDQRKLLTKCEKKKLKKHSPSTIHSVTQLFYEIPAKLCLLSDKIQIDHAAISLKMEDFWDATLCR